MDIKSVVDSLSKRRPIFHLESDFQFSLAWEIQQHYPESDIRLEVPMKFNKNIRVDIQVWHRGSVFPIELKYLKKRMEYDMRGELFKLAEGVHDMEMYGCMLDVSRLELLSGIINDFGNGYAVWLTNDPAYWNPQYNASYYKEFHAPDGATKTGSMYYDTDVNPRTQRPPQIIGMSGYKDPVVLSRNHEIRWNDYSNLVQSVRNGIFRYAVVRV